MSHETSVDPWLSVITVVKDHEADFARTLASIEEQDRDGVEYVVIDSSADPSAIPGLLSSSSLADCTYSWVQPTGIYPAMNAGMDLATGDYVYFANAGDVLHRHDVLARVRAALRSRPSWCFGDVEIVDSSGRRTITPPWDYAEEREHSFSRGLFPPHQGTFARRRDLLEQGGFDPRYSIVADYAAFLKLSLRADPVRLGFVVATFTEGGVSTTRWQESFRQFHRARVEILQPRGWKAARERLNSASVYAQVFAHREIRPLVRRMTGTS